MASAIYRVAQVAAWTEGAERGWVNSYVNASRAGSSSVTTGSTQAEALARGASPSTVRVRSARTPR